MRRRKTDDSKKQLDRTPIKSIAKRIKSVSKYDIKITALIYGRSGTGKTVMASTIADILPANKKVLILDIREDGTPSIADRGDRIDRIDIETWADLEGVYYFLKTETHPYGAFVLDTITQLQKIAMNHAMKKSGHSDMMSKRAWGLLGGMLEPRLLDFRDMPQHTVFIAQDRRDDVDEDVDDDDLIPEVGLSIMPSLAKTVNAMVNTIGHTCIKEKEIKVKNKVITKPEFRLRLGPHPLYLTKIRAPKGTKIPRSIANPSFTKIVNIMRGESNGKEE